MHGIICWVLFGLGFLLFLWGLDSLPVPGYVINMLMGIALMAYANAVRETVEAKEAVQGIKDKMKRERVW